MEFLSYIWRTGGKKHKAIREEKVLREDGPGTWIWPVAHIQILLSWWKTSCQKVHLTDFLFLVVVGKCDLAFIKANYKSNGSSHLFQNSKAKKVTSSKTWNSTYRKSINRMSQELLIFKCLYSSLSLSAALMISPVWVWEQEVESHILMATMPLETFHQ